MQLTAVLTPEDDGYVAYNPETGVASQGDDVQDALANLTEAVELYLEDQPLPDVRPSLMTTISVKEHA